MHMQRHKYIEIKKYDHLDYMQLLYPIGKIIDTSDVYVIVPNLLSNYIIFL